MKKKAVCRFSAGWRWRCNCERRGLRGGVNARLAVLDDGDAWGQRWLRLFVEGEGGWVDCASVQQLKLA